MDTGMKYSPPHQKKQVSVVSWICFGVAAVMYIFSLTGYAWVLLLQLIMVVCLCIGAYILIRYRFTSVAYELRAKTGHSSAAYGDDIMLLPPSMVDLAVHRAQGKRENMEFLMSLDKLFEVIKAERDTAEKLRGRFRDIRFYYYTVDLVKRDRTALLFDDEGDMYCIVIEREDAMEAYLTEVCRKNKEMEEI